MRASIAFCLTVIFIIFPYTLPAVEESAHDANISCQEAYELIRAHEGDSNFVIIDFRPKEKYEKAHLDDAIYFDVFSDEIDMWLDALDRTKTYLIYCTIGHRSGIALEKMNEMGFLDVYHMYEGVRVWEKLGYRTLPDDK